MRIHNQKITQEARRELRVNGTPEEKKLWNLIRNRKVGLKFKRQHSVERFIVDFYCAEKRLIIEIDGAQHNETQHRLNDEARDEFFKNLDYRVLRISNHEMAHDIRIVLQKIKRLLSN